MEEDPRSPFVRYLSAKRTVDDRGLNRPVLDALRQHIQGSLVGRPLRILELGAGNSTMAARLVEWRVITGRVEYVAIDADAAAVADGAAAVPRWAEALGLRVAPVEPPTTSAATSRSARLVGDGVDLSIELVHGELFRFEPIGERFDLVIANQFLDLVDVPSLLPRLWRWARPLAGFWFTSNYDGATILEPSIDAELERRVFALYHRTMDERLVAGLPSGDSRCGRHLFGQLPASGAKVLAAGASDSVVHPVGERYPGDEAIFLHHILDLIDGEVGGSPDIDGAAYAAWLSLRRAQVDAAELSYVARQLDFFGLTPARDSRLIQA
jgi:hypothetical protein